MSNLIKAIIDGDGDDDLEEMVKYVKDISEVNGHV